MYNTVAREYRREIKALEKTKEERNEELLRKAELYRDHWGTLTQMTKYYGEKYSNALEKAGKGEPYAYCLLVPKAFGKSLSLSAWEIMGTKGI